MSCECPVGTYRGYISWVHIVGAYVHIVGAYVHVVGTYRGYIFQFNDVVENPYRGCMFPTTSKMLPTTYPCLGYHVVGNIGLYDVSLY